MSEIEELIAALGAPLTSAEQTHGWTEESKRAMHKYFAELRNSIQGGNVPSSIVSVARALDHWGVSSGPLSDLAISISLRLSQGKGA